MFYQEHEPAHFHAEHSGQQAKFDFDGKLLAGQLKSSKARQRIRQWTRLHRTRLEANWERMKARQALETVEPLVEDKQ